MERVWAAAAAALLWAGCGPACPSGEDELCSGGDCICGATCTTSGASCPTGQVCGEYRYAPGTGICVDPAWLTAHGGHPPTDGGTSSCGSCASGEVCVTGYGCTPLCASDAECGTGCCVHLASGQYACGPGSMCGGHPPPDGGTAMCTSETSCVTATYDRPTGAGHCAGEMTGHLTNGCGTNVYCQFCFRSSSTNDCGGGDVSAGATVGGELGGIWSCGQPDTAVFRYACALPSDPPSCSAP